MEKRESKGKILSGWICSVVMILSIITYLIVGFTTNLWHPYWLIIVCSGLFCGIIGSTFDAVEKLRNLKNDKDQ